MFTLLNHDRYNEATRRKDESQARFFCFCGRYCPVNLSLNWDHVDWSLLPTTDASCAALSLPSTSKIVCLGAFSMYSWSSSDDLILWRSRTSSLAFARSALRCAWSRSIFCLKKTIKKFIDKVSVASRLQSQFVYHFVNFKKFCPKSQSKKNK